jgi:hypothetical protein
MHQVMHENSFRQRLSILHTYVYVALNFLFCHQAAGAAFPEYQEKFAFPSFALIKASQMNVTQCSFRLHTQDFKELRGQTAVSTFDMHIFIRYMQDESTVFIRTVMFLDLHSSSQLGNQSLSSVIPGLTQSKTSKQQNLPKVDILEDVYLHPELMLTEVSSNDDGKPAGIKQHSSSSWPISGTIRFPLEHTIHPYATTGNTSFRTKSRASALKYKLTVADGGAGKSCIFKPRVMPLRSVQSAGSQDNPHNALLLPSGSNPVLKPAPPSEAALVLNPMWEINSASLTLLEKHIEHYTLLGFNK